jgi:CsoR family transcriptional regulator, copper-sensing transcriptional repressor
MSNPDYKDDIPRLNRLIGQLNGIKKMIEDNRYCPDIILQLKAVKSSVGGLEQKLLQTHIQHCVKYAFESQDQQLQDQRIKEIIQIIKNHP